MRSYRSIDSRTRFFKNASKPSIIIGSCILVVFVAVLLITLLVGWIAGSSPENAGVVNAWRAWSWGLGISGLALILLGVWVYIKKKRWILYSYPLHDGQNSLDDIAQHIGYSPKKVLSDLKKMDRLGMMTGVTVDKAAGTITAQPDAICFGDYIDPAYMESVKAEIAKKAQKEQSLSSGGKPGQSLPPCGPTGRWIFAPGFLKNFMCPSSCWAAF